MERESDSMTANETAFLEWARSAAKPYAIPPSAEDLGDLQFLDEAIGNARFVLLGENSHYIREWNALRLRVFQYLVKHHGFRVFVLETGLIEGKLIYDYVLGADIAWDSVVESVTNAWGVWAELQELIRWMRNYNESAPEGRKLKFYGMDGTGNWYHIQQAYAPIHEYLTEVDGDLADRFRADFEVDLQRIRFEARDQLDEADWQRLIANSARLVSRMEQGRVRYVAKSSQDSYDWTLRFAQTLRDVALCLAQVSVGFESGFPAFWNTRDAAMAEHVAWIANREGPAERFLIGAHNIHFLQHPFGEQTPKVTPMGSFFANRVGRENLLVIATNCAHSAKGDAPLRDSNDYLYSQVGPESFFLDLRSAPTSGPVAAWLGEERQERANLFYRPVTPRLAWDCICFHRTISIATLDLPMSLQLARGTVDSGRLADFAGRYEVVSFLNFTSTLDIVCEGNKLYADGSSDIFGELFPPYRVELQPSEDGRFFWSDWPANLEFHGEGRADRVTLRMPGMGTFEGRRADS